MYTVRELKDISKQLKIDTLNSIYKAKSGHIGGCYSSAEIITALYFRFMNIDEDNPCKIDRDRFVLSKGHSAPILYAALARRGFFPVEDLDKLRNVCGHLQGAPNIKTPGIDMSSGPLGQGLSAAVGMALNAKFKKLCYKTYCLIGDGEFQEGQIWEAMMSAAKYKLSNLVCILDHNGVQMSGSNEELMPIGSPQEKFASFGWHVVTINKGNDMEDVVNCFEHLFDEKVDEPIAIIAKTTKGNGVSFMENSATWHGAVPSEEQYFEAMRQLKEAH